MGTYRLVLALFVLHSHAFGSIAGLNFGVVAVISFFIISGFVMAKLFAKHYPRPGDVWRFYADRAMRLFPQYLFYLVLTLILWVSLDFKSVFLGDLSLTSVLANAIILPLGFFMYWPGLPLIVPPAWSLSLEITFYLVFPIFMLARPIARKFMVSASVFVALAAFLSVINTDTFGYRLLPGTFFIFAAGIALASPEKEARRYALAAVVMAAIGFTVSTAGFALPYNREVSLGLLIGVPIVAYLARLRSNPIDDLMGNLSYGVFLNHFILIWLCEHFGAPKFLIPIGSIALAHASYLLVEEPSMRFRHRWRQRRIAAGGTNQTAISTQ